MQNADYVIFVITCYRKTRVARTSHGFDDFGLWVPDRSGATPQESGEWFIFVSGGASILNRIGNDASLNVPAIKFETEPFGNDIFAVFGDEFALPLLGNFDPPLSNAVTGLTNPANALDVNADTFITPLDALLVINQLGARTASINPSPSMYYDVNGDGAISPLDALLVINALSDSSRAAASNVVTATTNDENSPLGHLRSEGFAETVRKSSRPITTTI